MAEPGLRVVLVDGTYELFRHFYGRPQGGRPETAATRGVLTMVVGLLESGVTHLGVATDHVIESFRNDLWPGYKTGEGVDPVLFAQFPLLEEVLGALGVVVWPMVELEADDALASAAAVAAEDPAVEQVVINTVDKDLAQCVVGQRVVQFDVRNRRLIDEAGVHERYGVLPASIPDWLALVGDSADGFPGLRGWGKVSAATVLDHYGHLEEIPNDAGDWAPSVRQAVRGPARLAGVLAAERELADLFCDLATLRVDRTLLHDVEQLRWSGPADGWDVVCQELGEPGLATRGPRLSV